MIHSEYRIKNMHRFIFMKKKLICDHPVVTILNTFDQNAETRFFFVFRQGYPFTFRRLQFRNLR